MSEMYYTYQENPNLNNSLSTQYSDKIENVLMKVDVMKPVTTHSGAAQILFINPKHKKTKSEGKNSPNEILTNNYISDGGLKQKNLKYYNSTTFNKSNYAPTKINPNSNVNQLHLTTYSVNVRDNSELNMSSVSRDEGNPNNSITKIFVTNASKDKKEIRVKADSNDEVNKRTPINSETNNSNKFKENNKKAHTKTSSKKQGDNKIRAVSADSKKKLKATGKKEDKKSEDFINTNETNLNQILFIKNIIDVEESESLEKKEKDPKENVMQNYHTEQNAKSVKKIKKSNNKENETKLKTISAKDYKPPRENIKKEKIASSSDNLSKESEKEDRPKKSSTMVENKIQLNSLNNDTNEYSKTSNNVNSNNIKSKTNTLNHEKKNNYNTFNSNTPKINKSKNSVNSNQSNKEQIKILTMEEKIELMGKLVRNKEEEIIKQVQKEVIEKSKQTNEKIQRKLRYLNDRNMLDNINLEEIESGMESGMNEDAKKEVNEETDLQRKEEENEEMIVNDSDRNRKLKLNYFENSESSNKQKRSKSSPHVKVPNNQRVNKPRINTKQFIKQINYERRAYFGENDENKSNLNIETENYLGDNKKNDEKLILNNPIIHNKSENKNLLSLNSNNNFNNSFRKSNSGEKSKTVQRSASASASLNSRIIEGNENFVFSNNFEENYKIPFGSKNNKRSSSEIQEFIKRKRREDKEKAIKLKNEEDQKSLKKLVELTKIVKTQEKILGRGNYSHSQNPNSVNTTKSKNSEFNRYQENVRKSNSSNKIKNEMYVGKKKKNPNDSSIVDPNEYYLTLLESKNILIPTEDGKITNSRRKSERSQIINNENIVNDHSFNIESKHKIITDYDEKTQSQLISQSQLQSQIQSQSRTQSSIQSQIQSEASFNLKLIEKENSRRVLQQSHSHENIKIIQHQDSRTSQNSQLNQISQNSFIQNSSNFKSFKEKNSVYKQPSNENSFGNFDPVIDKSQKETTKRSIYNSNDVISMKSGNFNSKFDSSSFQQCDTANFKASNDINEKLNEMKAKVSEFKQRAINLRETNSKIETNKSLSARSLKSENQWSDIREDSLIEDIPKNNDKIQSLIDIISDEHNKDLRLSENELKYNEEDVNNQLNSNSLNYKNEEDDCNQMKSVSYDNIFSFNKRDRINSDMEMNYKSCDMNAITKNISSDYNNLISNQPENNINLLKISQAVSDIHNISIKEEYEVIKLPKIEKEKLIRFSFILKSAIKKNIFKKFWEFLITYRKLEQYDAALNYLDAIADGFIAKNVFVSFQMINQFAVIKNYYDVFNLFTIAAKRDAFKTLREYSEVVKLYEEEELHVYENSFNSLCLFAKRSAFNAIKEFAFNVEINEYEEDLDKLIEVYTISFNKLFLPWKRNLFNELMNNMFHLMMTPRQIDVEIFNNNKNSSNNPIIAPEDDNVTVQINKGQSPTNSQLWYNKELDDEDILRKNSNQTIQDKSLSQIKSSLIDAIQIESMADITNKSEVSKRSIEQNNKSTSRSKMLMFDKNAALSNSKPVSVNQSRESFYEKLSVKNSFRNIKNNTFVHESFTERSFLIEFNSFDSPKLHRIHMLIEQQKRAQQNNSQDQQNSTNNMFNEEISMNMSNITGSSIEKNHKLNLHPDRSNENSRDNYNIGNIQGNIESNLAINIQNKNNQNHSVSLNANKSNISNDINTNTISKQNHSNNYSLQTNFIVDMDKSNEINNNNIYIKTDNSRAKENTIINKSTKSLGNLSINSLKDNLSINKEVFNKSSSTLNKFSNVINNINNNYSNRSKDLSQDEISQNISEHLIDSRIHSRLSKKYSTSGDDVSIDMNKNEFTDIEWIQTISAMSKTNSYHDVNANNSLRNSMNMATYLDNQINKSIENSKIYNSFEKSRDRKQIVVSEIKHENKSLIEREKTIDIKNDEEVIDDEYGKFEENIEIEIDYNENDKDLFNLVEDEDEKNKFISIAQSNKSERDFNIDKLTSIDPANINSPNSSDINNNVKSRNITDNINKKELSLNNKNENFKNVYLNKLKNSLENNSYYDSEQFNNNDDSSRDNLHENLSYSKLNIKEKENESTINPAARFEDRALNKSIEAGINVSEEKIIIDENYVNDKITIETAKDDESTRQIKNSEIEFIAIKQLNSLENNNILTIESSDNNYNDDNREFFKVKSTCEIKSFNLLDDKSSNKSSIIPISDSDFRSIENKETVFKENQTLSANKRYEDIIDDVTSIKKSEILLENTDGNITHAVNEFSEKLKSIEDLTTFADIITENIINEILQSQINDESTALTPKKLYLREKDCNQSTKKDDSYLLNPQFLVNDSLSAFSTTSNNFSNSTFNKTVIEHKKEASLNLYQDQVAPLLIDIITESIEKNYLNIFKNLSHPFINRPIDLIKAITYRDHKMLKNSHKILPESLSNSTLLQKKEILSKFENTNKKIREEDNITSDNYYDNILNECMVDAADEILKKERHYGDLGEPLSWSTRTRSIRYKYNEYSANNMKKLVNDKLTKAIHFKMGLITENNENMEFELLNAERERRLLNKIIEELDETDEQWKNFEIEETQIKFELSDLIFEQLLNEIIEILEHVQLSRRKPQLYQNKSIYACEDIPRLSFQQNNTDNDSDNINQ